MSSPAFASSGQAAVARAWIGRALFVLGLSLLVHAVVLVLGHRALQIPAPEFAQGSLIEATLLRAPSVAAPATTPKTVPKPRKAAAVPPPPPPVAEARPIQEEEPLPPTPEPPAAPVEEPSAAVANPVQPERDTTIAGEFDASGGALLAGVENPPLQEAFLPMSARYVYQTTDTRFSTVTGTTTVHWRVDEDHHYEARLVTTVFGLTILELSSNGHIRHFGLAPARYTEKTVGRSEWATNFDWTGRRVTFSAKSHERELTEGMQDRLSFQFQLMALGPPLLSRFRPGATIVVAVGGRDDVSAYRFNIVGPEQLQTGVGVFETLKLERPKSADGGDSRIEVWLAPEAKWLPVKLRFTDRREEVTESLLSEIVIPAD